MKIFNRDLKPYTGNCNIARRAKYEWRKRVVTGQVRPDSDPYATDDLSGPVGAGVACIAMAGMWIALIGVFSAWQLILPGTAIMAWGFYRLRTMR